MVRQKESPTVVGLHLKHFRASGFRDRSGRAVASEVAAREELVRHRELLAERRDELHVPAACLLAVAGRRTDLRAVGFEVFQADVTCHQVSAEDGNEGEHNQHASKAGRDLLAFLPLGHEGDEA